eukprot:TRINITY_DN2704_c0_g1_i1.p1 TRINITY_DN2704_c0_g1~~TRINITY_DN2704_c0_g1_i1.p1  ORF type:complete len:120 (-),score=11.48 TRINITY_DN2704_c0_g1_i1:363-722(-)
MAATKAPPNLQAQAHLEEHEPGQSAGWIWSPIFFWVCLAETCADAPPSMRMGGTCQPWTMRPATSCWSLQAMSRADGAGCHSGLLQCLEAGDAVEVLIKAIWKYHILLISFIVRRLKER